MKSLSLTMFVALVACASAPAMTAPSPGAEDPKAVVRVAPARALNLTQSDEVIGTLRSRTVTAISASIMGTVRALHVGVGSHVRAGAVLMELAAGEVEAQANQASAMFAQAQSELQRAEQLERSKSISAAQVDAARAQFRVAEAALAEANVMRGYSTLRAPMAGIVTERHVAVGDLALPGRPLLTIENPGALRLEASVPEAIARGLHHGAALAVRIDTLETPLAATVSELGPSSDPVTRTVLVKLDVPALPELRPGMFGRLSVPTGEERVVTVPEDAVQRHGQMESVFVVEDRVVALRLIRTGRTRDGATEVLAGLDDGERVVVAPHGLVEGQTVEVRP